MKYQKFITNMDHYRLLKETKLNFQRFEFKYHLDIETAKKIENDLLARDMEYDPYVLDKPEKEYVVSSLYFDTPKLDCYNEKISGLEKRFKLRLRIYKDFVEEGDNIFLEIKRKNDMVVFKDRAVLTFNLYNEFFVKENFNIDLLKNYSLSPRDKKIIKEFFWKKLRGCMSPLIYVRYRRKPLIGKFNKSLRVTFDSSISACVSSSLKPEENLNELFPDHIVMEIKYDNSLPHWFSQIIRKHNLERLPFSKYCGGVVTARMNNQL